MVLSYEEAAALVRAQAGPLRARARAVDRVGLAAAFDRVLAEPVAADRDQPPLPRSTRDGFACRAADLQAGTLRVTGQLRAGEAWTHGELQPGEALEIMTGAGVPPGADCVAMIEHVTVSEGTVRLLEARAVAAGDNIVPAGAEARRGDVVVPAGRRMGITETAAAAACGGANLAVFLRPRVAILATGDELVGIGETPQPHQIRNSNGPSLEALVRAAGGMPWTFPVVADEAAATERAIQTAAANCDLLLLTGGVSMGKHDYVEPALRAQGAEFFFTGVRMQPGKPVVFGKLAGPYFFGLPGNPISTMVTFAVFVAPLLRALGGETEMEPRFVLARLEEDVRIAPGLTRFLPARMESDVDGARVQRIGWHGSGDLAAAARANSFLVVPETAERLAAGDVVAVLLL